MGIIIIDFDLAMNKRIYCIIYIGILAVKVQNSLLTTSDLH